MDKLTRLYKIMYGSMDNLFVNRREDYSHKHEDHSHLPKGLPPMTATKTVAGASTSSTHSKVSGYSSCTELSNNQSTYLTDQSSSSSSNSPITRHHHHQHHQPSRTDASNTLPNRLHHWPEEAVSTNSQQGDSDSCYSDSYSITYKPVSVRTEINYHYQHQHHQSQGAVPVRLSPFASRALSQSSQSLPVTVANSSLEPKARPPPPPPPSKKGSFSDLLLRKKNNKKTKFNKLSEQANRQTNQLTSSSSTTQLPSSSSSSSSPSSTQELKISSVKDLVEVLIYQLQVMERRQAQLEVQSHNLERANKVYQQKLELATRESELLKQKLSMLESEVWQCYLCSRDKIQLYSADVCVVALICGHLFCADCSRVSREECPKCGYKYTIDRQVHL